MGCSTSIIVLMWDILYRYGENCRIQLFCCGWVTFATHFVLRVRYENAPTFSSNSRGQASDGTLPRGLTITGEGTKQEEHIYEDPLYLKCREASEPTYKVPRPTSDRDTMASDEAGYEMIEPVSKAKKPKSKAGRRPSVIVDNPEYWSSDSTTSGLYELMQHPASVGKGGDPHFVSGSPAAYLQPVGGLEPHGISSGYSLLAPTHGVPTSGYSYLTGGSRDGDSASSTEAVDRYTNLPSSSQGNMDLKTTDCKPLGSASSSEREYTNITPIHRVIHPTATGRIRTLSTEEQEQYISMQSATLKH